MRNGKRSIAGARGAWRTYIGGNAEHFGLRGRFPSVRSGWASDRERLACVALSNMLWERA